MGDLIGAGLAHIAPAVLMYPNIDPVLVQFGPLVVRWYGLAYVAAFAGAWFVLRHLTKRWHLKLTSDDQMTILLAAVIGVIVGGRLGYVVFYDPSYFIANPARILATWDGGMSFHGGLIGILLAGAWASRAVGVPFLVLCDIGAVAAPIGFFFGRLANFVNGELWGRVSSAPWAMVFPNAGPQPRHPSQLYEAILEGLVIFTVLWLMSRKRTVDGTLLGALLVLYGATRIFLEQFRQPDAQLGYLLGGLTMGQLLSVPMAVVGLWLLWRAAKVRRGDAKRRSR